MAPFHDPHTGLGGSTPAGCSCTLQQAYDNGPQIQTSADKDWVEITRQLDHEATPIALALDSPNSGVWPLPTSLDIEGYGWSTPGDGGGGASFNHLTITAFGVSGTGGDPTGDIFARWEASYNGISTYLMRQYMGHGDPPFLGTVVIRNPTPANNVPTNFDIDFIMGANYWDGAAAAEYYSTMRLHMETLSLGAACYRFIFGTDETGAGGDETFRIYNRDTTFVASGQSVVRVAWNNGGTFTTPQIVLVGAQGTGPGGGTTRALYLAS